MIKLNSKFLPSLFLILVIIFSCKKSESQKIEENSKSLDTEISQEQPVIVLQNEKGEKIDVIYFAEGNEVAVRIKMQNGEECKLSANGLNSSGNPKFTDGKCTWEMGQDNHSGTLTDEKGNISAYKSN